MFIRRWLYQSKIEHLLEVPIGLTPQTKIVVDDFADSGGVHHVLLDTSMVRMGDVIDVVISIKAGPKQELVPFLSETMMMTPESDAANSKMFHLELPPCCGFGMMFTQRSGRPLTIVANVWRVSCPVYAD